MLYNFYVCCAPLFGTKIGALDLWTFELGRCELGAWWVWVECLAWVDVGWVWVECEVLSYRNRLHLLVSGASS